MQISVYIYICAFALQAMAGAMQKHWIAVPCDLHPSEFAILAVDANCSAEAYHVLQSKCVKPDMQFDYAKLVSVMQFFYAEKFDIEANEWKMKNMKQWDEALAEVYDKHF